MWRLMEPPDGMKPRSRSGEGVAWLVGTRQESGRQLATPAAEVYNLAMLTIPASQARQKWAQTLKSAYYEPVIISDHGQESAMILDIKTARRALQALEDYEDAVAAQQAEAAIAQGESTVPLAEIARELGFELD